MLQYLVLMVFVMVRLMVTKSVENLARPRVDDWVQLTVLMSESW